MLPGAAFAQSFEAADVHPSASATNPYTYMSGAVLRGERYDLRKATMLDLIRIAWEVDPDAIVGGPNWLELDRFDVSAKAPSSTAPETIKLMLRALLADRFKLALHKDTPPMPAFALTMGKSKPSTNPNPPAFHPRYISAATSRWRPSLNRCTEWPATTSQIPW
jgi:uncharacterized protein (TIGR03435 family)